jgi:hypothetical protein
MAAAGGANPIDVMKDNLLKGDAEEAADLTVDIRRDSGGYKGRIETVVNLG